MNAMKNKIKSQKGASITFALLLFLVCAIISSIVIVAATAVGGRASQMAELDQRYYAVNSAAELLRDVLERQTVTVTTRTKTTSTVDVEGSTVTEGDPVDLDTVIILKSEPTDFDLSTDTDILVATAARKLINSADKTKLQTLSLSSAPDFTDGAALAVTMIPTVTGDKLTINVSNTDTDKKETYTLILTFKGDIVQDVNDSTTYGNWKKDAGKYIRDKYLIKSTVSTIRWKLIDMRT